MGHRLPLLPVAAPDPVKIENNFRGHNGLRQLVPYVPSMWFCQNCINITGPLSPRYKVETLSSTDLCKLSKMVTLKTNKQTTTKNNNKKPHPNARIGTQESIQWLVVSYFVIAQIMKV